MKRLVRVDGRTVSVSETAIDRMVRYFNPVRGAQRFNARLRLAMAESYTGASSSRRSTASWRTSAGDADTDTLNDLDMLRVRSRDLIRNTPLATGVINTKVTSVVGTGLRMRSRIDASALGISDERAQMYEAALQAEWELFSGSRECDLERTNSFVELQELAFRSVLENGDVFVLLPMVARPGVAHELKVQLIEADRVSNPNWQADSDSIAGGVERDAAGAPVAYHMTRRHPGRLFGRIAMEWDRLPAYGEKTGRRNVLHLYRKLRVGQSRGIPDLAPVIEFLKQLGRYTDAELMAAVVTGMLTVFVKTETGEGLGPMDPTAETGARADDDDVKLGNGAIIDLAPGEDVTTVDPSRPNTAFDQFVLAVLRQVGVALELPYEILIKHFTASYSASRAAMVEAWKFFRARRAWLAQAFCQPVYEALVTEAALSGRVKLPGFVSGDALVRQAYLGAMWVGPAKGQIDEQKEVAAARERMAANLTTLEYETAEMTGGDWEMNLVQRAREKNALTQAGLVQMAPERKPGEMAPGEPPGVDDDSGDTEREEGIRWA